MVTASFIVVTVILSILAYRKESELFGIPAIIFGAVALFCIISLIANPMIVSGEIAQFNSVRETIRTSDGRIESTAIYIEVVKANAWLADVQYYNGTFLEEFTPDEVDELEPISLK